MSLEARLAAETQRHRKGRHSWGQGAVPQFHEAEKVQRCTFGKNFDRLTTIAEDHPRASREEPDPADQGPT